MPLPNQVFGQLLPSGIKGKVYKEKQALKVVLKIDLLVIGSTIFCKKLVST